MDRLSRDPRLARALGEIDPPPADGVDWTRLRAGIAARAEMPLARRRASARRRAAARWAAALAPAAAAAALAFALLPGARSPGGRAAGPAEGSAPGAQVEEVVEASYPARDVERLISGRADADALLLAAVGETDGASL
ncbi:MAG TPA: hypothetical protein VF615_05275 [Longimicrobiaceae bacterium]|jgi:hypothetical protein